jgi:hypothetical protein
MRLARLLTAVVVVGATSLGSAACQGPKYSNCLDATSSTASGTFSLVTSTSDSGTGSDDFGITSFTVDNYDQDLACAGGDAFLVHDATCSLHAVVGLTQYDSEGDVTSSAANTIVADPSLPCTVATAAGPLALLVTGGTVDVTYEGLTLDIAGTDPAGDALAYHFSGPWQ